MSAEAVLTEDKITARRGKPKAQSSLRVVEGVKVDPSRDALLTDFGKKTLDDRYVLPGETYQDMFARVATGLTRTMSEHAQRIYDYISRSGSCRRRLCCRMAAPIAACRSRAS
jgi:ribonucleoside-diphosphate reductase alpha chain